MPLCHVEVLESDQMSPLYLGSGDAGGRGLRHRVSSCKKKTRVLGARAKRVEFVSAESSLKANLRYTLTNPP